MKNTRPIVIPLPASSKEILIVRLKSLGDIVLSTIVAKELAPAAAVDYLIDETFAGVTQGFPGIRHELHRPASWTGRLALMKTIRRKYDVVIDMHGSIASGILARVASRGAVLGYRGKRISRLYDIRVPGGGPNDHTADINLNFIDGLGISRPQQPCIELAPLPHERPRAAIIHAGGRFNHKLWPADRFAKVAEHLTHSGYEVSLLLGPGERAPGELSHLKRVHGVADLGEALKSYALFVGNDSGPMHLAAAAGCRVIGIFGPSNPMRWRPYSQNACAVSTPCACGHGRQRPCLSPGHWCMEKITVEDVIEAITRILPQ